MKIKLIQTCGACPEQYDAFHKDKVVGYLRLRHGNFTVTYPNVSGAIIYQAYPKGDGMFDYDERQYYLKMAKKAIKGWIRNEMV